MNLNTPVSQLNRVGSVLKRSLAHLGIETVEDLLNYFPFRYEDYSHVVKIQDLQEGQEVTIRGRIELIQNKRSPRKRTMITEALVADETGQLRIVWFGQAFITQILKVGDEVFFSGKVKSDMFGVQMISPGYEKARNTPLPPSRGEDDLGVVPTTHTARIVPIYSLTAGVTEKQLRFLVSQVILPQGQDKFGVRSQVAEWLPEEIRDTADLMPIDEALRAIHFPESQEELVHAQKRLKFDELFLVQLRAEMVRQSIKKSKAPIIEFKEQETKEFVSSLPFELTKDQKVSAWEILQDMGKSEPMNRLLEGDVGSGKTVVAAMALYNTVLNGFQGVMMAPTEILASQHFESLVGLLGDKINIVLLTRSQFRNSNIEIRNKSKLKNEKNSKQDMIDQIADGSAQVVVGTHAILSENVEFKKLGLVIVDEQHRFGVAQRKTIKDKSGDPNTTPHFLSMTATPIPRSFALTVYGDLDLSIIRQMPPGRKIIKTRMVDPHNRQKAYEFISDQVKQGRQVFVICPLIAEKTGDEVVTGPANSAGRRDLSPSVYAISSNNGSEKKSVMQEYEKLSTRIFPNLKVGFLHGKLKPAEKDETMSAFAKATADERIDILVATSVVEVGVDIPNASVMMIEGAERFGLAQLHQFRGRVGRSEHQSYCFLFTDSDSYTAQERLKFFEKTSDGFELAEYDLKVRGPGEVYGVSQSGMMNFKLATLQDHDIIKLARDTARGVDFEKYGLLKKRVEEWEEGVHLE